jgi:hypothetical protein
MPGLASETDLDSHLSGRMRFLSRGRTWSLPAPSRLGPARHMWETAAFSLMWLFIGSVSCYDAYLILKYQQSITVMEMNPLGCWLLAADGGEPTLFLAAKFQGTIVVLGTLQLLHRWNARWGQWTAGSVAAFQAVLLAYLTFALPY